MQSTMTHQFAQVPSAQIPRSKFDRSAGFKATFDAGDLIPIFVDEVLPGDTFSVKENLFGRLNTPLVPFMDNLFLDTFYFFVPNRLLWDNWQKFNGEQKNPGDSTDFLVPQVDGDAVGGFAEGSIFDYMGIPTKTPGFKVNSLHMRAYNLIWNEWFRDQNLQQSAIVNTDDGPDDRADFPIRKRGKRHDYFTSCLPFPQKGPAVTLPLGTSAPVTTFNGNNAFTGNALKLSKIDGTISSSTLGLSIAGTTGELRSMAAGTGGTELYEPRNLQADLSAATAATINQLREAFQIQRLYERDARGGTRYTEIIRSHFGVISPDARLQRPEYLGGGSSRVNVNPVAQNSATGAVGTTPQGNLAAFGTVSAGGRGFAKSFTEHGVLIGLASLRADLNYQQGVNRMWSRRTRFDFYLPVLSHLGEQAVLNKEIWAAPASVDPNPNDGVFGYQERFAEYRYKPSIVTGKFRSNATGTLDIWHAAQNFANLPTLSDQFIQENPPIDRLVATPDEPHMKLDAYFQINCARPMPIYSVPGLIDHF